MSQDIPKLLNRNIEEVCFSGGLVHKTIPLDAMFVILPKFIWIPFNSQSIA